MTTDRWLLVALAVVWALAGLIEPHLPNAGQPFNEVATGQSLLTAILLFGWCKAHARTHAIQPPAGAAVLTAFLAPIGFPYYVFKGFGFRTGLLLVALSVVVVVGLSAVYLVCFQLSMRYGA